MLIQTGLKGSGPAPKTHLLLVQGGQHPAFVGDFHALVEFFQKEISPRFGADFWTVYGAQQYFEDLKNYKHATIKFEDRVMVSRHTVQNYEPPYTYVDPTQICQRVFQWLDTKADTTREDGAKPGDSIILIILAHGSAGTDGSQEGIRLGNNDMLVNDFVAALRKIPRDVQVNAISNACYSAAFAQGIAEDEQTHRWIQVASQPGRLAYPAERSASGRYQNSGLVSGLVRSLASLGRNNSIDLGTLQTNLTAATQARAKPRNRTVPFLYTDAPLSTQVQTLLLRSFADFPFTPENTAARRRKELNIDMFKRPFPVAAALMDKQDFAANMIAVEFEIFKDTEAMSEDGFGTLLATDWNRQRAAGTILRGMLVRGRLQAAVLDVFMQLCLQGVCSLGALEYPVDYGYMPPKGTCRSWIRSMLYMFEGMPDNRGWESIQREWGINQHETWFDYDAPHIWLGTMIGRSFTNLRKVFDVIRTTEQLGPLPKDLYEKHLANMPADPTWKADILLNRREPDPGSRTWPDGREPASGTFAFWLPEYVNPAITQQDFDTAAAEISRGFYQHLERLEYHYRTFFDISEEAFNADVQEGERDVRDWARVPPASSG